MECVKEEGVTSRDERCPVVEKDVDGKWAAGSVRGQEQSGRSGGRGTNTCLENVRREQSEDGQLLHEFLETDGSGRCRGPRAGCQ